MRWPAKGTLSEVDLTHVGQLQPLKVLYEFDGPCIFTAQSPAGALLLAYLAEDIEEERRLRTLVVTTSETTVGELERGTIPLRDALLRGSMWVVDRDYAGKPLAAFAVNASDLPEDALPGPGTMLVPALEPALRPRLDGPARHHETKTRAAAKSADARTSTGVEPESIHEQGALRSGREDEGGSQAGPE